MEVQKARDEKWSLSMGVLKTGFAAIKTAVSDLEAKRDGGVEVQRLFEANKDSLYLLLDKQVSNFDSSLRSFADFRFAARFDRHGSSSLSRSRRVLGRIILRLDEGTPRRSANNSHSSFRIYSRNCRIRRGDRRSRIGL